MKLRFLITLALFVFCMATVYTQTNTTIRATKAEIRKELRLAGRAVKGISRSGTISGAGSHDSLLTQKAVKDYVTVMIASGRVTLRNTKPSPLTTYISELVIDTAGVDSAWVWNFSIYRLLQTGGSSSTDLSYITDAATGTISNSNGTPAVIPEATDLIAGLLTATKKLQYDSKNSGIQFKDEGTNLGTQGTVTEVNVTGAGTTASRSGNVVTLNVDGGGSGSNDTAYINNLTKYIRGEQNLRNWRRVINNVAKSGAGNAKILLIGDSNTEAPSRLYTPLKSFLGNSATNNSIGWVGFSDQVAVSDLTITKGGTWATSTYVSGLSLASEVSSAAASTLTIATSSSTYNVCRIHYRITVGGGSFSWNMDGGGATTVSTNGTAGTGVVTISGLSNITHSLVLTVVSGTVELYGMVAEANEVGVQIYKAGRSASTTANWAANTVTTTWKQGLKNIAPDLVIVTLGSNDVFFGNSVASYNTNMKAVVGSIRETLGDTVDVMLIACADYGGAFPADDNGEFRDVVRKIAYDSSLVFLSYFDIHKSGARNQADGVTSDNVHWTSLGGYLNAGYIGNILTRTLSSAAVDTRWTTTNTTDIRYNTGAIIASGVGGGTVPTGYSYSMQRVVSGSPESFFHNTSGGTNGKNWDFYFGPSTLYWRAINDANSGASNFMQVDRTGTTIDALTFAATKYVFGNNDFGIGVTTPTGLEVRRAVNTTARGAANVRFGLNAGFPSIFMEDASGNQINFDVVSGVLRFVRNGASVYGSLSTAGLWRFGDGTAPTAYVNIRGGTTTVPPLQFTSGTNTSTPLSGAAEYDGNEFYFTTSSGSRTIAARILKSSATLNFGSISAGATATLTVTVTGAATTDSGVSFNYQNTDITGVYYSAKITSSNTVTITATNLSGAPQDPDSGTCYVTVIK